MSEDKPKIPATFLTPGGKVKEGEPYFKGTDFSQPDIACNECGYVIAQGVPYENIRMLFTDCPNCGSLYQHHTP